ncbi:MAG: hypothetical protein KGL35_31385 [Bradyrhizobium sp.]|nr:hypothetical protein [Bradyrhizobium sp.]
MSSKRGVRLTSSATWTPAMDAALAAAWHELPRLTTTQIGVKIGCTKNAAIGRARRLGLPSRGAPVSANPMPRKARTVFSPLRSTFAAAVLPVRKAVDPAPLVAVPRRLDGGCQWVERQRPVTMCGCATWRGAWCRAHYLVVYQGGAAMAEAAD